MFLQCSNNMFKCWLIITDFITMYNEPISVHVIYMVFTNGHCTVQYHVALCPLKSALAIDYTIVWCMLMKSQQIHLPLCAAH